MADVRRSDRVRDVIFDRLEQFEKGRYVRELDYPEALDAVERRRVTEYTGGVIRNLRWLDYLIDHWARDASGIDPVVRRILRIGAYELVVLAGPPHAILNGSVEQAKRRSRGRGSSAFVNAILRQIARNSAALPEPATGDATEDLAIRFSHPTWMVSRWVERYGLDDTARLLAWNNTRPSFGLRVNALKTSPAEIGERLDGLNVRWRPSEFLRDYLCVENLQPVVASGLIEEGLVAVQDESAGLVVDVLDPQPGEFLIDACAAPGGKTILAGIRMQNRGRVLAVDPNKRRLRMGMDAAARHGVTIIQSRAGSFLDLEPAPDDAAPDRILLDVPCSGLGVLARRADLRWRKSPDNLEQLTRLQDGLLDKAADLLRPGGILTYATCTIEPEENGGRVDAFLTRHPDFALESASGLVEAGLLDRSGRLASLPHVHRIDGAFAARLRKNSGPLTRERP